MRRASNDNNAPPPGEKVVGNTLANRAVIEQHITVGLQTVLKESGVPAPTRKAVAEFISPVLATLDRMEGEIIDYARTPGLSHGAMTQAVEAFGDVVTRFQGFATDFQGMAQGAASRRLATAFSVFVNGLERAWELPMAEEIEEPEPER